MNATIYATILTGLGIVMTLIVTMHNLAKNNQQETNRRINDLKQDLRELLEAKFKVVDEKFRVIDAQFEVVGVRVGKLEEGVVETRQEVQDLRKMIFKPAA
jgi:selenocysteine-specific translation elongation factor